MQRGHLDDLLAFLAVAREQSFTKAAAKLGVSQSALSHTMRALEARLGVRLLTRTTRRVAPTAAGERLLHALGPRFEEIEAELAAISDLREKPAGTIRITATEYAADAILLPKLGKLLRDYSAAIWSVVRLLDFGECGAVVFVGADRADFRDGPHQNLATVRASMASYSACVPINLTNTICRRSRTRRSTGSFRQRMMEASKGFRSIESL